MKTSFRHPLLLFLMLFIISCRKDDVYAPQFYNCSLLIEDNSDNNPSHLKYLNLLDDIKASGVPGILMAISSEQDGMWLGAAGEADLKSNIELQSCNITRVGSTVKTFTATTILLLVEEGKINLDDEITDYLSDADIKGLENAELATVRQLLQHSSGIYNYIQNLNFQTESLNDLIKEWKPEELLNYARNKRLISYLEKMLSTQTPTIFSWVCLYPS